MQPIVNIDKQCCSEITHFSEKNIFIAVYFKSTKLLDTVVCHPSGDLPDGMSISGNGELAH